MESWVPTAAIAGSVINKNAANTAIPRVAKDRRTFVLMYFMNVSPLSKEAPPVCCTAAEIEWGPNARRGAKSGHPVNLAVGRFCEERKVLTVGGARDPASRTAEQRQRRNFRKGQECLSGLLKNKARPREQLRLALQNAKPCTTGNETHQLSWHRGGRGQPPRLKPRQGPGSPPKLGVDE